MPSDAPFPAHQLSFKAQALAEIQRYGVTRRWADAVAYQGVVYLVEVPDSPDASAEEQIRMVLAQVDMRLQQVGSSREKLLMVQIFLPDPAHLAAFNAQWDEWIPAGHAPARACVHTPLAAPGYCVELVITAAVDRPE